jgi:hypothetical protein
MIDAAETGDWAQVTATLEAINAQWATHRAHHDVPPLLAIEIDRRSTPSWATRCLPPSTTATSRGCARPPTDWRQIALPYARLGRMPPTRGRGLNRAVAVAVADGLL